MKKARIFLTALTVLAVVGGALAFKTKIPKNYALCDTVQLKCLIDPQPFNSIKTTPPAPGVTIGRDLENNPCVFTQGKWTCTAYVTVGES